MNDESEHRQLAETGRKMHHFTVVRGAKLELNDVGVNGVLVQVSNPHDVDDCVSILLQPTDANMLTSWLQIYTGKHRGPANGKKIKKGNGGN